MEISIKVIAGDATTMEIDVLALKYAQANHGVDSIVTKELLAADRDPASMQPKPGEFRLVDSAPGIRAKRVLFVGVVALYSFEYLEIREFSRRVLSTLAEEVPDAKRVALTLHGAGYGLDEAEAFESEVAGLVDSI